jgi:hypothetical protein
MTGAGLDLVSSQTFLSASAVSVNNCFTSTYDNYRILVNHTGSVSSWLHLRLRLAGTDATGANFYSQRLDSYSATTTSARLAAVTFLEFNYFYAATPPSVSSFDIYAPALPQSTGFNGQVFCNGDTGNSEMFLKSGGHSLATSYDGMTLYPLSGTVSGTLRIYGYKNS